MQMPQVLIPYIFTSFSNFLGCEATCILCFNTIYLYIILKRIPDNEFVRKCFNTIYLYIILKRIECCSSFAARFNTIYLYIILKL